MICAQDSGFNRQFLEEQLQRRGMLDQLVGESCEQRTAREAKLWSDWLDKYSIMKPDREEQKKNTIRYVLLNETAKNITNELNSLQPLQQR